MPQHAMNVFRTKKQLSEEQKGLIKAIKHHGDTKPQKLEHRRQYLTGMALRIKKTVEEIGRMRDAETIRHYQAKRAADDVFSKTAKSLSGVDLRLVTEAKDARDIEDLRQISEKTLGYDIAIANLTGTLGTIEGLALIVDTTSIRVPVKINGQVAYERYSACAYLSDILSILSSETDQNAPGLSEDALPEGNPEEAVTDDEAEKIKARS